MFRLKITKLRFFLDFVIFYVIFHKKDGRIAHIETPLGITKIIGSSYGISQISIEENATISSTIPLVLQEAVEQLQEYFAGLRKEFTMALHPKGTDFQQQSLARAFKNSFW